MSPVPYRGKPNRPAYVVYVNGALASTLAITPEVSAEITTQNAERFFRL
jgi:TatD DNase family protein